DLAPDCRARVHLTVLPPRPLHGDPAEALESLKSLLVDVPPFAVELGDVEIFPGTKVIYIALQSGYRRMKEMHEALNVGPLTFDEPYPYHPHITLAQETDSEKVAQALDFSKRRWDDFQNTYHTRSHVIDHFTFVQNTLENRWLDLSEVGLASHV